MLDQNPYTEHASAIKWVEKLDKWRNLHWDRTFNDVSKYFNSH